MTVATKPSGCNYTLARNIRELQRDGGMDNKDFYYTLARNIRELQHLQ